MHLFRTLLAALFPFVSCAIAQEPPRTLDVTFYVVEHPDPARGTIPAGFTPRPIVGATVLFEHIAYVNGQLVNLGMRQLQTNSEGEVHLPLEYNAFATGVEFRAAVLRDGFQLWYQVYETPTPAPCDTPNFPELCRPNHTYLIFLRPAGGERDDGNGGTTTVPGGTSAPDGPGNQPPRDECDPSTYIPVHSYNWTGGDTTKLPCSGSEKDVGCTSYHCQGDGSGSVQYNWSGNNSRTLTVTTSFSGSFEIGLKGKLEKIGLKVGANDGTGTNVAASSKLDMKWGHQKRPGKRGELCVRWKATRVPVTHCETACELTTDGRSTWWEVTTKKCNDTTLTVYGGGFCLFDNLTDC